MRNEDRMKLLGAPFVVRRLSLEAPVRRRVTRTVFANPQFALVASFRIPQSTFRIRTSRHPSRSKRPLATSTERS